MVINPYQNNLYAPQNIGGYTQPYYSPYQTQQRFQQSDQMAQPQVPVMQQPIQARGLNGMIVPSVDKVTADCVPMDGSAAFFPKQDLSEIYVKNWCADGTIRTLTFKPVFEGGGANGNNSPTAKENTEITEVFQKRFDELVSKIEELEKTVTGSASKKVAPVAKREGGN